MFLVGLISWWYGKGWRQYIGTVKSRLAKTLDFFSIATLIKTLFKPFRQISAGKVGGPLNEIMKGLVDNLISRMIGTIVRSGLLVFGLLFVTVQSVVSVAILVFWGLIPVFPIMGLVLMALGWAPSWL